MRNDLEWHVGSEAGSFAPVASDGQQVSAWSDTKPAKQKWRGVCAIVSHSL
jgi:hypothetical protein